MKRIIFILLVIISGMKTQAQEEILLYPNGMSESNELDVSESFRDKEFIVNISTPRMYVYPALKDAASGTAVLICPGGGYSGVSQIKEGQEIAYWFNRLGITAFVLYYRMPNGHHEIPLKDAQTALSIIHSRAKEWNIKKNKIGIMGFSAGGHLASTAGTHFTNKTNRPAFMILAYPVITMDKNVTHGGSRTNLLGKNPTDELVRKYSNELQVTRKTPPAFVIHALDDKAVPVANSENFVKALKANKIPATLVTYEKGGHGFGMRKNGIPADNWDQELLKWLLARKLVK